MQHIALKLKADADTETVAKLWYNAAKDNLPSGIITTIQRGERNALVTKEVADGYVIYKIALIRNLTTADLSKVSTAFDLKFSGDYTIESTHIEVAFNDKIEVEIPDTLVDELTTKWKKDEHSEWMKKKLASGWSYGVKFDRKGKTHPLLRQWSDLPEQYRKGDTEKLEAVIKMLNDSGYVIVHKSKLDEIK